MSAVRCDQRVRPAGETPAPLIDFQRRVAELRRGVHEQRIQQFGSGPFMAHFVRYYQHRMAHQDGPRQGQFVPPAPVHHTIASTLDAAIAGRLRRVLVKVFRGAAKSTQASEAGLPYAITQGKRNVLLISSTFPEARNRLQGITFEQEYNTALRADHPELAPMLDAKGQFVSYRDDQVVFANGGRLKAYAMGAKLRGSLWHGARPDFVLLDDPETDEMQLSETELLKAQRWIARVLIPALSEYCPIVWLGTPPSPRSLMLWAEAELGFPVIEQPVYNADGSPHWPAYWPEARIQQVLEEIKAVAFSQEYLLRPLPDELAAFGAEDFSGHCYAPEGLSTTGGRCEYSGEPLLVVSRIDCAVSLKPGADRTAIATVGVSPRGKVFVLELRVGRWTAPQQKEQLLAVNARWRPTVITFQETMLEQSLKQQVLDTHTLPLRGVKVSTAKNDKLHRIRGLAVHTGNGKVWFNREDPGQQELKREMDDYPFGKHDDCLDALEGAVTDALGEQGAVGKIETSGYLRDSVDAGGEW